MNSDPEALDRRRDEALRDLVELERQVEAGEIPPASAQRIRGEYERAVGDAMAAAERAERNGDHSTARSWSRGTVIAYLVAAAIGLIALIIVLPGAISARPPGSTVTGDDLVQTTTMTPPGSSPLPSEAPAQRGTPR